MNYIEAQQWIEEKNGLGILPGLTQVTELLRRLGNPQDVCKTLHIAGTNGKGSIFAFVQEGLLAAGFSVGRYVSPTICTYLERYTMNKEAMCETEFASYITKIAPIVAQMEADGFASPTAFEIETAIAFCYFAEHKVDYVLLECGMGGRLDATNVLKEPALCVFAQISMDHMQFLGTTLTQIAQEKAGIIKPGTAVISAPQPKAVRTVLQTCCADGDCPYTEVNPEAWTVETMELAGSVFRDKTGQYEIPLLGEHQISNAETAIMVLRHLHIEEAAIQTGLKHTSWQGRMTKISDHPAAYVDGAHNLAAWEFLRKSIEKYFTNRRIIYIIGVLKDKEYEKMVEILAPTMEEAVVLTPDSARGLQKEVLAALIQQQGVPTVLAGDSNDAWEKAKALATEDAVIMISGSLSFLGDFLSECR